MKKNSVFNPGNFLPHVIAIPIVFLILNRTQKIFLYQTKDFDTDAILRNIDSEATISLRTFFDIAHPGFLSVLVWCGNQIQGFTGLTPLSIWGTVLSMSLVVSAGLLFFAVHNKSNSIAIAYLVALAYLASPVVTDLASRAEENFLYHPLLAYLINDLTRKRVKVNDIQFSRIILVMLLGAIHFQPFAILAMGMLLHITYEIFQRKKNTKPAITSIVYSAYVVPTLILYVILRTFVEQTYTNYATVYYSIFNNDSMVRYLKSFFMFMQGFNFTGIREFTYSELGTNLSSNHWILGLLLVCFVLVLILKKPSLLNFVTLAGMTFPLMYEPNSSERWDVFLISFILLFFKNIGKFHSGLESLGFHTALLKRM